MIGSMMLAALLTTGSFAQERPDPDAMIAAQKAAMERFSMMDGVWRGPAWGIGPTGEKFEITQTERVGDFLDGAIKVIEGRGYEADGTIGFNALGIISSDPTAGTYTMRSYAMGNAGDFPIKPTDDGFQWEIPAGPMTIRYTATIDGDTWREVGDRITPEGEEIRFFEMTLTRVGDTDWPAGGAIEPE
ncbi:MAG: DUF1579 domain-containing protein [Candidatus Eisenbacteria bacterium]|nr:DUF1579 domain-containing protein [Candidatus Latescibacterota bacterium]MBD3302005.1 DUF1579 domain-containing protein [Candidatus Eisenbacteria bacterium]